MSMTPETMILDCGSAKVLSIIQEQIPNHFPKIFCWQISTSQKPESSRKTRADQSLRSVLSDHEDLEYGINIFKKHEMGILYFPTRLKELEHLKLIKLKDQTIPIPTPTSVSHIYSYRVCIVDDGFHSPNFKKSPIP